jgi:RHS repeat-associated protein
VKWSVRACVAAAMAVAASVAVLAAPDFPVSAVTGAHERVISKPLPPGKISNGPLKLPAQRPASPPPPRSPEGKAEARMKASVAASLAARHRAAGPPAPAVIRSDEAKIASLRARHLLTRSTSARPKPVRTGPRLPVTTVTGPSMPQPAGNAGLPAPARLPGTAAPAGEGMSALTNTYGAKYSINSSGLSVLPTYKTQGYLWVTVTNTGNFTWSGQIQLSYHMWNVTSKTWYNFVGEFTDLGATVPPGYYLAVYMAIDSMPAGSWQVLPDLYDNSQASGPGWFSEQSPPVPDTSATFTVPHLAPTADLNYPLADATIATQQPQFELNVHADMTQQVYADYEVCDTPATTGTCWDSGWQAVSMPPVPYSGPYIFDATSLYTFSQVMFWNKTYYWRARVEDSITGVWSAFTSVTPVVPDPAGPGHFGVDPASVDPAGVNLFLGDFTQQVTDAHPGGTGVPLQVVRTYNSADTSVGAFGTGWSSVLDMTVTPNNDGTATVRFPGGLEERFGQNPDGAWVPSYGKSADATISGSSVQMADGTKYTFSGPLRGDYQIASVTGADGSKLTMTVDSTTGHVTAIHASPSGRGLYFGWTGAHVTQVTLNTPPGGGGLTWNYFYTGDLLTKVCDPDTNCTVYGYGGTDSTHPVPRLTSIQKPDTANLTTIGYAGDFVEDVAFPANGDGSSGTWTYRRPAPPSGEPQITEEVDVTDPDGIYTDYQFDNQGSLYFRIKTSPTAGPDYTRKWQYDLFGEPASMIDENQSYTGYSYTGGQLTDVYTYPTPTSNPDVTQYQHYQGPLGDPRNGKVTQVTDANNKATSYTYDPQGQLLTQANPATGSGTGTITNTYTCENGAAAPPAVDAPGLAQPCGLLSTSTDAGGLVTRYGYDENGDLAQVTDPHGVVTGNNYDAYGRLAYKTVTTPPSSAAALTDYSYNGAGQVLTETDPAVTNPITGITHQLKITNSYDGDGNLMQVVQSDLTGGDHSRTVAYTYDARDRQATVTDNGLQTSSTVYNGDGLPTENTTAAGADYHFFYSIDGDLSEVWLYGFIDNPASPGTPRNVQLNAYGYDWAGRMTNQVNARNQDIDYGYYSDNLLQDETTSYTDPDTQATRTITLHAYTYDNAGNTLTDVQGDGAAARTTTMTYDAMNNRLSSTLTGAGGFSQTTSTSYNLDGMVTEADTPDPVQYGYDTSGQLDGVFTGLGQNFPLNTTYTRDGAGNPLTTTDGNGNVTTDTYDLLGRLSTSTGQAMQTEKGTGAAAVTVSPVTTYGYDTFGDRTDIRDPDGHITHIKYDNYGRQSEIDYPAYTAPSGTTPAAKESWTYTNDGQVYTHTDRSGNTTTYLYDQRDRLVRVTAPAPVAGGAPAVTSYTYDDGGDLLSRIDPDGAQTLWTYDDLERPISMDQVVRNGTATPTQIITQDRYDDFGDLTSVNSGSVQQSATYDAAGNQLTLTQAGRGTTYYSYNPMGEVTSVTDAMNRPTSYSYDPAGRLTGVTTPAGTTSYTVDYDGNITQVTDPRNNVKQISYNPLNEPVVITDPPPSTNSGIVLPAPVTTFGYDAAGNQTRMTDGDGNTTYQTYNSWNLPETTTVPATSAYPATADGQTTVSYDQAGRPRHVAEPGGTTIDSSYDNLGRLAAQTGTTSISGNTVTTNRSFGYDLDGNLTAISTPAGTQNYTYNDMGQLTGSTGPLGTSGYGYDTSGRLGSQNDPGGTVGYTYNPGTTDIATQTTFAGTSAFSYNLDGQETRQQDTPASGTGGTTLNLGYDTAGRLTDQRLTDTSTGASLASTTFGWDPDNNLTTQYSITTAGTVIDDYSSDADNRLIRDTNVTSGTGADYTWDSAGNRTSVTSWSGTAASHTTTSTAYAGYDQRNEPVGASSPAGYTQYQWTARGTQEGTLRQPGGSGGSVIGTTTNFDAFNQIHDYTINGTTQTYSHDALGRTITAGSTTFSYGGLSAEPASDGTYQVTRDPAGTAVAGRSGTSPAVDLLDNTHGDVTAAYSTSTASLTGTASYDPFGQPRDSTLGIPLGYQGSWTDPVTGLVNAEARLYDPSTGTFLSPDPAAPPVTTAAAANTYLYADANPATYSDPTGQWGWSSFDGVIGDISSVADKVGGILSEAGAEAATIAEDAAPVLAAGAEDVTIGGAIVACAASVACALGALAVAGIAAGTAYGIYSLSTQPDGPGDNPQPANAYTDNPPGPANQPNRTVVPPHPVSTSTWIEKGTPWTEPGGQSWDNTYLYTYTDHYQYVTTYQQVRYSDGSLSAIQKLNTTLEHWQTVTRQAILNFSDPVKTPQESLKAQKAFNNQVPGSPSAAQSGAGCGGGGPPSDCNQTGPGGLPPGADTPATATGAAGGNGSTGGPPRRPALPAVPEPPDPNSSNPRFVVDSSGKVTDTSRGAKTAADIAANADVSTGANQAFFWSNVPWRVAADIARSMGGTTLEGLLEERGIDMPMYDPNDPDIAESWFLISARFADQASGLARAILGPDAGSTTVWNLLERPTLENNPLVTRIGIIPYNP